MELFASFIFRISSLGVRHGLEEKLPGCSKVREPVQPSQKKLNPVMGSEEARDVACTLIVRVHGPRAQLPED